MPESIKDQLSLSLDSAEALYYRIVLLVGESGTGKTSILQDFANSIGTKVINVNLALSAALLELTARQRALRLPELLKDIVAATPPPAVLDNIEILFEKELRQDPLRLLLSISRNHKMVASWNGTMTGDKLTYAEPGHPEYKRYDTVDALIIKMKE